MQPLKGALNSLSGLFCCPQCGSDLVNKHDLLECANCGAHWPVIDGIPCFLPADRSSEYMLAADMDELNAFAVRYGWRAAAQKYAETQTPRDVAYSLEKVSSEARADFQFLMPIGPDSVILDVGSGWGNISIAFARTCRRVFALDAVLSNLRFVQIRAHQEDVPNVVPVCADASKLPLPPSSCDAALIVGVLEWVAWGSSDQSPGYMQECVLRGIHRVLRPGGVVYVGIENRFEFEYFLGVPEPHTGLRFISLMPRYLADLYSRRVRRQPFREWTYSLHGLRSLLKRSGFTEVKFFFPVPGYQNFRYLLDFEDPRVTRYLLRKLRAHPRFAWWYYLAGSIAATLGMLRWFAPCFSVIARKQHD